MKRLICLLVVALASAAVTYFLVGLRETAVSVANSGSDLAWLRAEFDLGDEQFAAVERLHDEYSGRCAQHCTDIIAAREHLAGIAADAATERAAAAQRVLELEVVCNEATRTHLRRVASVMPADQGERFLRMVEPHLAQLPHDGARGFRR